MNNFPKWVRICQINKLQNVLLYIYIYIYILWSAPIVV